MCARSDFPKILALLSAHCAVKRRTLLVSVGGLSTLAGCSVLTEGDLPAGTVQFENRDDLPHVIEMSVEDGGEAVGDGPGEVAGDALVRPGQRTLTAAAAVGPGETQTFEHTFTESIWYSIVFTVDGHPPANDTGRRAYNPAPSDATYGNVLSGTVYQDGSFSWGVAATNNPGKLSLGGSE